MTNQNSNNQDYQNNSDGFALAGGDTKRKLTISDGDVSIQGGGTTPTSGKVLTADGSGNGTYEDIPTLNQDTTGKAGTVTSLSGHSNTELSNGAGYVPNTRTVNSKPLTGNISLTKSDVGLGNVDNTSDATKQTAFRTGMATTASLTNHTNDTNNPHSVTKAQVGLGNVNNTSDATKDSATATLSNKTLVSPVVTGDLTGANDIYSNGEKVLTLEDIFYKSGDTFTYSGYMLANGLITSGAGNLSFHIYLDKLPTNVTPTITVLSAECRTQNGYMSGTGSGLVNLLSLSSDITVYKSGYGLDVRLTKSSGTWDSNNIPASLGISTLTVTFA